MSILSPVVRVEIPDFLFIDLLIKLFPFASFAYDDLSQGLNAFV